jgi:predicted ATPase
MTQGLTRHYLGELPVEVTGFVGRRHELTQLSGLLPNTAATSLGLPEQDVRSQLDAIIDYLRDRQLLFARRAATVVPGFAVTSANRADAERLCRRLDLPSSACHLAHLRPGYRREC